MARKPVRRRMVAGVTEKQCLICERWVPVTDWPRTSTGTLRDTCSLPCSRIKQNRYYHSDPSHQRAATERWTAKNKDRVAATKRAYQRRTWRAGEPERAQQRAERQAQRAARRQARIDHVSANGKVCMKCGEHKAAAAFTWNKARGDYESWCKPCRSKAVYASFRKNHPAKYPGTKGGRAAVEIPIPVGECFVTKSGGEREIVDATNELITVKVINRFGETLGTKQQQRRVVRDLIKRGNWVPGGEQYFADPGANGFGIRVLSMSDDVVRYRGTTPEHPTGAGIVYHMRRADFDRLIKIGRWIPV